jgi:hypothetical protein
MAGDCPDGSDFINLDFRSRSQFTQGSRYEPACESANGLRSCADGVKYFWFNPFPISVNSAVGVFITPRLKHGGVQTRHSVRELVPHSRTSRGSQQPGNVAGQHHRNSRSDVNGSGKNRGELSSSVLHQLCRSRQLVPADQLYANEYRAGDQRRSVLVPRLLPRATTIKRFRNRQSGKSFGSIGDAAARENMLLPIVCCASLGR